MDDDRGNDGQALPRRESNDQLRRVLLARLAEQREEILDTLWLRLPTAQHDAHDGRHAVKKAREAMGRVFDLLNECAAEGRDLRADEIAWFEERGACRRAQGMPLDAVLEGFRTAFDHWWERLASMAGDPPEVELLMVLTKDPAVRLFRLREQVLEALQRGYRGESSSAVANHLLAPAVLLDAVLNGGPDDDHLLDAVRALGYGIDGEATLIVASANDETGDADIEQVALDLTRRVPGAVAAPTGQEPVPHAVALTLKPWSEATARTIDELATHHKVTATLLSVPIRQLGKLGVRFRRLRPQLRHARRVVGPDGRLSRNRLAICEVLTATSPQERAPRFVAEAVGSLLGHPPKNLEILLRALDGLREHGGAIEETGKCIGRCARSVGRYIARIEERTGLSARNPEDMERLSLAVWLLELYRARLPPVGSAEWIIDHDW